MWEEPTWDLWLRLILGSSVLAAFLAFGLELGKSSFKERVEHNKKIQAIYNELKTVQTTLENKSLGEVTETTYRFLLPKANIDYLMPKIAGEIKSKTFANLQQIQENIERCHKYVLYPMETFLPRNYIQNMLHQINLVLEELKNETKRVPLKPKLE